MRCIIDQTTNKAMRCIRCRVPSPHSRWGLGGKGLVLIQTTLIENLALAHGVNGVKHSLPTDLGFYMEGEDKCNQKTFQKIIGGQLYIARTT